MRRFLCTGLFFLSAVWTLTAQPVSDSVFRVRMNALVSKGNVCYDRSDRDGILAHINSLRTGLDERSQAGMLNRDDSLQYSAEVHKLLGDWYYEKSFYEEADVTCSLAEEQFNQAMQIYRNNSLFAGDMDKIPMINRELAQLYYRQGRYHDAYDCISEAEEAYSDNYQNLFEKGSPDYYAWLDIRMQQALCLARIGRAVEAEKKADGVLKLLKKKTPLYYESLRKKAKILLLSDAANKGKRALPLYKTYFLNKKQEALSLMKGYEPDERQRYWMRMRPFLTDCYLLEGEDPGFLFDVSLFSKGLLLQLNLFDRDPNALKTLAYTWKDIQKALPADGCAMECIQYEKDGQKRMGAILLRKKGKPVWVPLLGPDAFMDYQVMGKPVSEILQWGSEEPDYLNALYWDEGLKELLWTEALRAAIGPCEKVYFSPDGYLHQMAVEYMLPPELEGRQFHRLSSARQIALKRSMKLDSALLCGGVSYDYWIEAPEKPDTLNDALAHRIWKNSFFPELFNTELEAWEIFMARNCPQDTLLVGEEVTEKTIRNLMGQYNLVHLATHGGFNSAGQPMGTDLKPCMDDQTLSESVIAFAGSNQALLDPGYDSNYLDGILSAREIAKLDLTKTNLAVISACQTNLGFISSDGVYGIQRGLKDAGAGGLVLSLWSVDDHGTCVQMMRFHENLKKGMDVHSAFFAARDSWKTDYWYPYGDEPVVKNAFILIDIL